MDKCVENGHCIVSLSVLLQQNDQKLLYMFAVDNPKRCNAIWWRIVAAPIDCGNILRDALPCYGSETERKEQVEREYKWGDTPNCGSSILIGMKKKGLTDAAR